MRRRWPALAAAIVSLGLAAGAALLALEVDASRDALRDGDVRQAAGEAGPDAWEHTAFLPGELAERLLGVRDDVEYRRAVALFAATRANAAPSGGSQEEALAALSAVAADPDSPTGAAQAANLAGVLAAEAPGSGSASAQDALRLFRSSISSDPGTEHAKRNLERLLGELRADARASGPARERGRFGRRPGGAGLSPPGEGY